MRSSTFAKTAQGPKPSWLKVRPPGGENWLRIKDLLRTRALHTVCEEARCPNLGECWSGGTATFMILGDTCTRACGFCAVKTGNPHGVVDAEEPRKLAETVEGLGLRYVVITTVDRDDLADGGAAHFAACIDALHQRAPEVLVEVLTGDFRGDARAISAVLAARPDVFAHNVETVERLSPTVRDRRASYRRSLDVLARAKALAPSGPGRRTAFTKSSVMLGHGETDAEVEATLRDLRAAGVDLLTIGQYLRPTPSHLPVVEFAPPERFARLRDLGLALGFRHVASGPLVRSSYKAGEHFVASALHDTASSAPSTSPSNGVP